MAKLATISSAVPAERQNVSKVRRHMQDIANICTARGVKNAAKAAEAFKQLKTLTTFLGGTVIRSGDQVVMPVPTGTRVTGYVVTVNAAGVITALVGY